MSKSTDTWGILGSSTQRFAMQKGSFQIVADVTYDADHKMICCEYYIEIAGAKIHESIGYTRNKEWRTEATHASGSYLKKLVGEAVPLIMIADDIEKGDAHVRN